MSRLDEIRARCEAASPGPWLTLAEIMADQANPSEPWYTEMGSGRYKPEYDHRRPLDHEGCDVWPWHREEDMVFAYKAREDIPFLLAEIERLKENT